MMIALGHIVPDTSHWDSLCPQDRADLDFALTVPGSVDVVALSFVQKPEDVQELKNIVQGRCRVSAGFASKESLFPNLCSAVRY